MADPYCVPPLASAKHERNSPWRDCRRKPFLPPFPSNPRNSCNPPSPFSGSFVSSFPWRPSVQFLPVSVSSFKHRRKKGFQGNPRCVLSAGFNFMLKFRTLLTLSALLLVPSLRADFDHDALSAKATNAPIVTKAPRANASVAKKKDDKKEAKKPEKFE